MAGESGTSKTGAKHNYYICTRRKREKTCDRKAIRQELIENLVLHATVELINSDEMREFIAECTWQYYLSHDFSKAEIEALQKELNQTETAIQNLIRAIEMGIINDATKKRMDDLTTQQKELTTAIADRELSNGIKLTKQHIKYFLDKFKGKDYTDRECQKQLIKVFVNSIFLYDDHIDVNYNYSGGCQTISLTEMQKAEPEKEFVCCAPCSRNKSSPQRSSEVSGMSCSSK